MSLIVDPHTHSTASDGTLSPSELVTQAGAAGVGLLALTDHDNTEGVAEAREAASGLGIELVSGIEISVTWNAGVVHIVGLDIDIENPLLCWGLAGVRAFRQWRAVEIGERLAKVGIPGAYEGARALSNGRLISRTHFARFLVARGYAPDMRRVFKRFLVSGKPGHVPGRWARLEDAVAWVRAAGGQAVIAHPARYSFSRSKLRRLIGEFSESGGSAIEVVSGSHTRAESHTMGRHARDFGLLGSVGSDYHGPESLWNGLGCIAPLPDGVGPVWAAWGQSRQSTHHNTP
ncbi:MAG: PHP domain-containing protein [Candidatus Sedimenticola endophacoides]